MTRIRKQHVQTKINRYNEVSTRPITNLRRETHYLKGFLVWVVDYNNGYGETPAIIGYTLREAYEHLEYMLSG